LEATPVAVEADYLGGDRYDHYFKCC